MQLEVTEHWSEALVAEQLRGWPDWRTWKKGALQVLDCVLLHFVFAKSVAHFGIPQGEDPRVLGVHLLSTNSPQPAAAAQLTVKAFRWQG